MAKWRVKQTGAIIELPDHKTEAILKHGKDSYEFVEEVIKEAIQEEPDIKPEETVSVDPQPKRRGRPPKVRINDGNGS